MLRGRELSAGTGSAAKIATGHSANAEARSSCFANQPEEHPLTANAEPEASAELHRA